MSPSLMYALFRRSPTSLPGLKGKVVLGRVLPAPGADKFLEVDAGLKGNVTLLRSEVGPAGAAARPGDVFPMVVEHLETPLGEPALNGERARDQERLESVWQEVKEAYGRGGLIKVRRAAAAAARA